MTSPPSSTQGTKPNIHIRRTAVDDGNVRGQVFHEKLSFHATAEQRPRWCKPEEGETLYRLVI